MVMDGPISCAAIRRRTSSTSTTREPFRPPGDTLDIGDREFTAGVCLADFDGDQQLDIVVANGTVSEPRTSRLYMNDGVGGFVENTGWEDRTAHANAVAAGDVDDDGLMDLVMGVYDQTGAANHNRVYEWDPELETLVAYDPPFTDEDPVRTAGVAIGDLDADGDLDVVFGNSDWPSVYHLNEAGVLGPPIPWDLSIDVETWDIDLQDFDGDGFLDILLANWDDEEGPEPSNSRVYTNRGDSLGVWRGYDSSAAWTGPDNLASLSGIAIDIDGARGPDLIFGTQLQPITVFLNRSPVIDDTATLELVLEPETAQQCFAVGDVDQNGTLDIVLGGGQYYFWQEAWTRSGRSNRLFLNDGSEDWLGFPEDWVSETSYLTHSLDLGDVNGDTYLDLVCGNIDGPNTLFLFQDETLSYNVSPDWQTSVSTPRGRWLSATSTETDVSISCAAIVSLDPRRISTSAERFRTRRRGSPPQSRSRHRISHWPTSTAMVTSIWFVPTTGGTPSTSGSAVMSCSRLFRVGGRR